MLAETQRATSADESSRERAVSPVLGVVLMVAITVVLAAVIGAFVLDIEPADSTSPNANFEWNENASGAVTITHDGGQSFDASRTMLSGDPVDGDISLNGDGTVDDSDWGTDTSAGDRVTVLDDALAESGELVLLYDTGAGTTILDDFAYANNSEDG